MAVPAKRHYKTKPRVEFDLEEVERLARLGLTQEKIAQHLHISEATLYSRKKTCKEFRDAITRGQIGGEIRAADFLGQLIEERDKHAIMFYLQTQCGWKKAVQSEVKAEVKAEVKNVTDVKNMTDAELMEMIEKLTKSDNE